MSRRNKSKLWDFRNKSAFRTATHCLPLHEPFGLHERDPHDQIKAILRKVMRINRRVELRRLSMGKGYNTAERTLLLRYDARLLELSKLYGYKRTNHGVAQGRYKREHIDGTRYTGGVPKTNEELFPARVMGRK